MSEHSDKWSYEACRNLGKAVCAQFFLVWERGSIGQWRKDKKRFGNDDPAVIYWFMLAERYDLFEKLKQRYRHYSLERWRRLHPNPELFLRFNFDDTCAIFRIQRDLSLPKRKGKIRYDDPWLADRIGRLSYPAYALVRKKDGIVLGVSLRESNLNTTCRRLGVDAEDVCIKRIL